MRLLDIMTAFRSLFLLAAAWCAACGHSALAQRAPSVPAAPAAPHKPAPADKPMQVSIVRLAQPGCEPNCIEWIAAQGRIEGSTLGEFKRVLAKLGQRKLPILIDSAGGSVDPALAIGRLVRAKGLDVVVTKTTLAPCDAADAECRKLKSRGVLLGKPEARISKCASSCAFVLAGGIRRYVGVWTVVGLHEIKSISTLRLVQRYYRVEPRYAWGAPVERKKTLVKEKTLSTVTAESPTDEKTYERIKTFFVEMGVTEQIMPILRSAPNSSIRWLRVGELRSTGIATDLINGEQLLLRPGITTPPPAVGAVVGQGTVIGAKTKPGEMSLAPPAPAPSMPTPTAAATASPVVTSSITPAAAPAAAPPRIPATAGSIAPVTAAGTEKAAAKPKPKSKAARPAADGVDRWSPFAGQ